MKTDKKPKIAVIGLKGLPAFGGAATVGENIIEQLKDKFDFTVYSISSHTDLKSGNYKGICYQKVFKSLPFKRLNSLYYYIISALHAVLCTKYDMVHLHHRDTAFILILLKIKYKVMLTAHGSFFVRDKWLKYKLFFELNERYFVKKADIVTCVSLQEQRDYKNKIGLDVTYIPNGINLHPYIKKEYYPEHEQEYMFFGAGRIIKTKGLEILLKSLRKIRYPIRLVVAGDLEQTPVYKKEILDLSKDLNVEFIGLKKNKDDLLKIICEAKLFIFPSSYEAMSIMLMEGVSTQCPCIASDIIQNKDLFNENEVLYFKTDNVDDLAEKINWALMNYDEMLLKSKRAYTKLLQHYTWDQIAKKYSKIYEDLLSDN